MNKSLLWQIDYMQSKQDQVQIHTQALMESLWELLTYLQVECPRVEKLPENESLVYEILSQMSFIIYKVICKT